MTRQSRAMPVGMLRSERPQLRQIIACERAALDADRFHWPQVLRDPAPRVQPQMSNLQATLFESSLKIGHSGKGYLRRRACFLSSGGAHHGFVGGRQVGGGKF